MDTSVHGEGEAPRRLAALAPERRACFALARAERLVTRSASLREAELRTVLEVGWSGLASGSDLVAAARVQRDTREGLDDDEVAAVAYALDAVPRVADGARWVAVRALDAAFDLIPYRADEALHRPLAEDEADPAVQ